MSEADYSYLAERISAAHQLGQLEGRISALERKVDLFEQRIEGKLSAIDSKLDALTSALHFGRGGWKVLAVLASLLVALGGLLKWLVLQVRVP
jgi:hypothetical protein